MPKFFIEVPYIHENTIEIKGEDAKHIKTVLRSKIGEEITLCDTDGIDYHCEISAFAERENSVFVKVLEKEVCQNEPNIQITLFQGLPKADKMELIVQKAVELGVYEIVGVSTERTIVKLDGKEKKKIDRWQKISESASKQSYRGIIPEIHEKILTFSEAIVKAKELDCIIIPYEKETDVRLKEIANQFKGKTIGIFIGPEGGFSEAEIQKALANEIKSVTLGKRILRTETAGFLAIGNLLYDLEK